MKKLITSILVLYTTSIIGQTINPCEHNTIQTQVTVDTFVIPDAIFLKITTHEKETSDELDKIEKQIISKIQSLNVDNDKNLKHIPFGIRHLT